MVNNLCNLWPLIRTQIADVMRENSSQTTTTTTTTRPLSWLTLTNNSNIDLYGVWETSIPHVYLHTCQKVCKERTQVLENKVDRMQVSNAFSEWIHVKSSTSEGRRQCCSSFLRNLTFKFNVNCDSMLNIAHNINSKPRSLCCYCVLIM